MVHYPLTLSHWHDVEFAQFHITNPYKKKLYGEIAGDGSHQYNHYPEDYQIHANEVSIIFRNFYKVRRAT